MLGLCRSGSLVISIFRHSRKSVAVRHMADMSSSSSSSSFSTINWKFSNNSQHVDISLAVSSSKPVEEESSSPAKKLASCDDDGIPDTVLQYERQLRKVQAEQRATTKLGPAQLKIIYEDDDVLVADKPAGVLCVPGLHNKPSLLQLVCQHCNIPLEHAPKMIVHRLDMDTSGVVVFAKTEASLKILQAAFRDRQVDKEYHALICGHFQPESVTTGHIHLALQRDHEHPPFMRIATPASEVAAAKAVQDLQTHGFQKLVKKKPKPSHTEFVVLSREWYKNQTTTLPVTRVSLIPHTGRTHQLRVHCAALGYPILSDAAYGLYGESSSRGGLGSWGDSLPLQQQLTNLRPPHENAMCLHATKLSLQHPVTGQTVTWEAPTPF
jgi:tRNA pseudouridine32 synthase/23S rRNA pseudouridine746 synthase